MKNIRFAFALNNDNLFARMFIDADKFQFYEYSLVENKLEQLTEKANPTLKNTNDKINSLIDFLKENNINMLVAHKFSRKLKVQCKYFIPIIIDKQIPVEQICVLITQHIKWLIDELSLNKKENMVFNITNGIYKFKIDNRN